MGGQWELTAEFAVSCCMEVCFEDYARRAVAIFATGTRSSRAQGTASSINSHAGCDCGFYDVSI